MLTEYMNVVQHGRIHVVRNRFFGLAPSLFELYDNSPLRKAVEERQGLSLFLPQLATRVTNLVQSSRLTLPYTDLPAKREAAAPVGYAMSAGF